MGDGPPLRDQCQGCSSLSYDQEWQRAFGVKLCLMCKANDDLVSKVVRASLQLQYCLIVTKQHKLIHSASVQAS